MPKFSQWRMARSRSPIAYGFLIATFALVVVGVVANVSARRIHDQALWVEHTYQVLSTLDRLDRTLRPNESEEAARRNAPVEVAQLRALTRDNPVQQQRIDVLERSLSAGTAAALPIVDEMMREEQRLLAIRQQLTDDSAFRANVVIILSTVLAVAFMAAALIVQSKNLEQRKKAELAVKDSEAKYRLLVEQAADAILIVDENAVCVQGNERAALILGRPQSEIPGLPLKAFVRGSNAGVGPLLPMLRYGHVTTGEFWVARPDGTRVAVEIRATLLEDGRVQVIARDISERKEIERVKDEFVSVVSHELRTPLTSIRGALGLLAAGKLDNAPEKRQRMLDLAASNTDRLIRLINDILDIERITSGGVALDRTAIEVSALVHAAADSLRPTAERNDVRIEIAADDVEIWADHDRITQTLTNLIDNAIKFSPRGSVIDVSARRTGMVVQFEVRDRGRGIPEGMLNTVFNRFQQVDNSDSREKGGSGLGLAISRSIVDQHGGRIWVESTLGEGSTFKFTIPVNVDHAASESVGTGPRVLVVDDDIDLIEVLRDTLAERGYRVVSARRGKEAIERFDAVGADLVIIDMLLPDISGLRVLRHVHATSPQTRIIVYTATYVEGPERDFIKGIGAVIVTKSRITPQQLVNEVQRSIAAASPATEPAPLNAE